MEQITEPKFKQRLLARFFVRWHMTVILSGVVLCGLGVTKLLLIVGVHSMLVRYPIAVLCAYGAFFLLVRLWLWYIGVTTPRRKTSNKSERWNIDFGGTKSGERGDADWRGFGGGRSGGAGASDDWSTSGGQGWLAANEALPAASNAPLSAASASASSSSGASRSRSGGFDFDFGDDGAWVIVLLVLLLVAIFGGALFLIYQAPAILADVAFEAALAAGLIKATKRLDEADWMWSLLRATVLPFVIVLALAIAFGWAAQRYCPAATKAVEILRGCN